LDEQYGIGAEQADAEAQDDIVAEIQEAIDSTAEYSHRYWSEIAVRAVARLAKAEAEVERLRNIAMTVKGIINSNMVEYDDVRNAIEWLERALSPAPPSDP